MPDPGEGHADDLVLAAGLVDLGAVAQGGVHGFQSADEEVLHLHAGRRRRRAMCSTVSTKQGTTSVILAPSSSCTSRWSASTTVVSSGSTPPPGVSQ